MREDIFSANCYRRFALAPVICRIAFLVRATTLSALVVLGVSSALAQSAQPFVVSIAVSVSGGANPIIDGTTNLPDGAKLWLHLMPPYPECFPHCGDLQTVPAGSEAFFAGGRVIVKNGKFFAGPQWEVHWPQPHTPARLIRGTYILEVRVPFTDFLNLGGSEFDQPAAVKALFGPLGQNIRGPLVDACCFGFGLPGRAATSADAAKDIAQIANYVAAFGHGIYYARYVTIP